MYFLINFATCLFLTIFVNINTFFRNSFFIKLILILIEKFEKFKKRIRFKLEIAIRDALFK